MATWGCETDTDSEAIDTQEQILVLLRTSCVILGKVLYSLRLRVLHHKMERTTLSSKSYMTCRALCSVCCLISTQMLLLQGTLEILIEFAPKCDHGFLEPMYFPPCCRRPS